MPRQRDQQQRREHARDLQPVAGFEDAVRKPRRAAAGAGDELGNHRADQRKPAGDLQAAEEIRQRGGQAQIAQGLPAARAVELEQVDQIMVGRVEPEDRVRQDREERHDPGADQQRQVDVADPDDDQRRDRDDRRHLQDHRIGEQRFLQPLRLREDDRERDADRDRGDQRRKRDAQRDPQRFRQRAPVVPQRLRDQDRAGQDVMRDALDAHHRLPGGEHHDADHHRRDDAGPGARRQPENAPLLREHRPRLGVGAVMRNGVGGFAHAAIACFKVPDATRHRCAYSAEVRNRSSRG